MNLSLFRNYSGKKQGKCKGEVYLCIHEPAAFFAATPSEWIFQRALRSSACKMR